MLRAVQQTLEKRGLLQQGAHALIAVSGGADSVALTYVLHYLRRKIGLSLTLAHLNHRIRGDEASEDARFVRELAWRLGLPCVLGEIDVPLRARSSGISMEMAAREARYDFLARVAREVHAACLVTAHTSDDQVETVLLKLARGSGPQGLSGIAYELEIGGIRVVRPMRDVTHEQAVQFLRRHRLKWREDSSNADLQYLRNRVRHEILPMLESTLNPRIREAILRTSEVISEENAWLNVHAGKLLHRCRAKPESGSLNAGSLSRHAPAMRRRVLRLWLTGQGVDPEHLEFDMIQRLDQLVGQRGGTKTIGLPGNKQVVRRYEMLSVQHGSARRITKPFRRRIAVPGETVLPDTGLKVVAMQGRGVIRQTGVRAGHLPAEASLDRTAVGDAPLLVRSWKKGDRIKPLGLHGSRKLQDVFVDEKVPKDRRASIPIFECRGEVVWIPGYRVASGWEVKDASGPALHVFVHLL